MAKVAKVKGQSPCQTNEVRSRGRPPKYPKPELLSDKKLEAVLEKKHNDEVRHKYLKERIPKADIDVKDTRAKLTLSEDVMDDLITVGYKAKEYAPEQKIQFCVAYTVTGNLHESAELATVPYDVAAKWRRAPWWDVIVAEIRRVKLDDFDAKASYILDSLIDSIQDRLDNGEDHFLRDGTKLQKKVSTRDLASVFNVVHRTRQLSRGEATSRTEKVDSFKKLEELADKFKKITHTSKDVEGERID